jgi:uncharacterized protein (TIGR02145 family)
MKKFILAMGVVAFAVVGCDDSSSASAGPNDEPGVESSSSVEQGESSSSVIPGGDPESSSEKAKSSSSSVVDPSTVVMGVLIDSRDGQTYKTVTIGTQIWMAENLNYETTNSYCYDDDPSNCSNYGRLYTWAAAATACPIGWHLPSDDEWNTLFIAVGGDSIAGKMLKSAGGWNDNHGASGNGTDTYAFSALPAGVRIYGDWGYDYEGTVAHFWSSSTEGGFDGVYNVLMGYGYDDADLDYTDKYNGYSVRCLKDYSEAPMQSSSSVKSSSSAKSSSSLAKSSSSESSSSVSEVSSSSLKDFDWSLPKETYLNPEIKYDSVTDTRDGKVYRTVKIGEQTWMAENLNFDPGQGGSGEDKYDWSWCYNDEPANCDVTGRFYTWAAAIDSVKLANDADNPLECGYDKFCDLTGTVQGICPTGWHLPSQTEWDVLFTAVGGQSSAGKVLKSQSGWYKNKGTDAFGFAVLPAGLWNHAFNYDGWLAYFWCSTENDRSRACDVAMDYYYADVGLGNSTKYYGFSVRCVKDE